MNPYEYEAYDMALSLGQSIQSKGGHARARVLTPEQRSEIASKASNARWKGHVPKPKIKGRRVAPRAYKDLPEYLAPILAQYCISAEYLVRIQVYREIIAKALEERE